MKPRNENRFASRTGSLFFLALGIALTLTLSVQASSHREAPAITRTPTVDATDFYMFKSYEAGRENYVTFVANYIPLQDAYGGPNYFAMDPDARYEIKIDNDGDAVEDWVFRFEFDTTSPEVALPIGPASDQRMVAVPLINVGPIVAGDSSNLNRNETYTVALVDGPMGTSQPVVQSGSMDPVFTKPVDNIGLKSLPDYEAYAAQYVYDVDIPDCTPGGRVFVGQRKDPFVVNLGETFDLINLSNPLGPPDGESDDLADKNVTSIVIEVPQSCLLSMDSTILGAWTTASVPDGASGFAQVSRLSNPLVNEVVIGLEDKDAFNASMPSGDGQFLDYVTHPTLPALIELLFGVPAPTAIPRTDLVAAFLTGVDGLNKTATPSEMLRLNTAIPAAAPADQNPLGVIGGDLAGFPNGRRPGDDVVDIALRVVMGALLPMADAPVGQAPFTDGAYVDAGFFEDSFPYLKTPIPGSPGELSGGQPPAPMNLLANGDFSAGLAPWRFFSDGVATASAAGELVWIGITTAGTNVQLLQSGLPIVAGETYRLTFEGGNIGGDDVTVALLRDRAPFENLGLGQRFDLSPSGGSFEATFVATADEANARLMFFVGTFDRDGQDYFFRNVVLERVMMP